MTARSSEPALSLETGAGPEETDEPFRLLVEQVGDYAIFLLDLQGRVSSWNVGAERIKGYTTHEILGNHFSLFFTEDDRASGKPAHLLEAATLHGRHEEEEAWRVRKNGSRFPAHVVVTALRDSAGQLRGFAKITRDLTQRRATEEAARRLAEERAARVQAERAEQERRTLLRRRSDLNALRADVSSLAATHADAALVLDRAARSVVERLGVTAARIWIFDDHGVLRLQAGAGAPLPADRSPEELRRSVVARIAETGAPAVSNDLAADPGFGRAWDAVPAIAFGGCPLMTVGHALGVLGAFGRGALPDDTLDALRGVADVLANSLERRWAEAEVRRSRDQLAVILSTISDGVTALGKDGRLIFVNDAAARVSGFASADEMLATPPAEILSRFEMRDERGALLPPTQLPSRTALQGKSAQMTLRYRDLRTGQERWSQVSSAPVLGETGEVDLAVTVFTDLTDRKRSEEAWRFLAEASAVLAASLAYEETLASVARLAVPQIADWCTVDVVGEDGQIQQLAVAHTDPAKVEAARAFHEERPRRPVVGGVVQVVTTGEALLIPEISRAITDTDDEAQCKMIDELGLRSAMVVPLLVAEKPFGAITFAAAESGRRYDRQDLMLAQEIARRASLAIENARAYREAREAVRMRDTFLSIASHELKTPLSSLTLLLSGLLRAARGGRLDEMGLDKLVGRLSRIEEQADRLTELMNQLLDVSRLAAGRFALAPTETDLVEVAKDVLARFKEEAVQAGTALMLEESGPVVGLWDRSRLDQVFTNLLTNALKYGGGSAVSVQVHGDETSARLVVTDRGPGISEADQARVFEQYERAASTNLGGLGLGLWIVRQLVQAHEGEVSLHSRPGQGASFTVVLPRRRSS